MKDQELRMVYKVVPSNKEDKTEYFKYFLTEERAEKFLSEMPCLEGKFHIIIQYVYGHQRL